MILSDFHTFNNPLGTGVVHLLLCCIWLQNSVKHVGFSLIKTEEEMLEGDCVSAGHRLQGTVYSLCISKHYTRK